MKQELVSDSSESVEIAAFCWPDQKWEAFESGGPAAIVPPPVGEKNARNIFVLSNFNDLHRAAAVLVGRGFAPVMSRHLIREEWPVTAGGDFVNWLLTAPADAWARAILATVREVAK